MSNKPLNPTGGKGSVRRNEDTEAYRNNYDAIFGRKSAGRKKETPMNEHDDNIHEDIDDTEYEECTWCGGCGEGDYDGAACRHCHGTGIEPSDKVGDDDYV